MPPLAVDLLEVRSTSFAPAAPMHLAAATGFATALTARACGSKGQTLWIVTEFALMEGGGPYGPGLDLFGLPSARLLVLRVPRAVDALWAMEEALRCPALDWRHRGARRRCRSPTISPRRAA